MKGWSWTGVVRGICIAGVILFLVGAGQVEEESDFVWLVRPRESINAFTLAFARQYGMQPRVADNVILSPQSLFHGLAMSYLGADGETREELRSVVGFPQDDAVLLDLLGSIRAHYANVDEGADKTDIRLANAIWVDDQFAFLPDYEASIAGKLGVEMHAASFQRAARVSRDINAWVSRATQGHIREIVQPADFGVSRQGGAVVRPSVVGLHVLYFKSEWANRFDQADTRPRRFWRDAENAVETPMMQQFSILRFGQDERFKMLELPYDEGHFQMYVLLPHEIMTVPEMLVNLSLEQFYALQMSLYWHRVDVLLPRFQLETSLDARSTLQSMGLRRVFEPGQAELTRMLDVPADAPGPYLSHIRQEGRIEVDEKGSVAVVATRPMFSIACSAGPSSNPRRVSFHADRPFLFLIGDRMGNILFVGWLTNP